MQRLRPANTHAGATIPAVRQANAARRSVWRATRRRSVHPGAFCLSPGELLQGATILGVEGQRVDADGVESRCAIGVEAVTSGTEVVPGQRGARDDVARSSDALDEEVAVVVGQSVVSRRVLCSASVVMKRT